jgi:hypothetical protein
MMMMNSPMNSPTNAHLSQKILDFGFLLKIVAAESERLEGRRKPQEIDIIIFLNSSILFFFLNS